MSMKKLDILFIVVLSSCLKVLLIPSYTSTDFEVHRNWLAVTHSLPHHQWYFEDTSQWTLDYPPFFAWFEKFLSSFARIVDSSMVNISNLNYKSDATLYFQRSSVILSDLVLVYAGYRCIDDMQHNDVRNKQFMFMILLAFNFGLLIVDHIHFQYNGFLFGIQFLSFANAIKGSIPWSAFWFSVLLNFKHIFLYVAPAYGVYFLRTFCMERSKTSWNMLKSLSFSRLSGLAFIVISVFLLSFGPFLSHLNQVFSRLFPFKRGLTHAYWAPNFWALYNGLDKMLSIVGKHSGFLFINTTGTSTSGLVQEVNHAVLPPVSPLATFLITFLAMLPCLFDLFFYAKISHKDSINQFLRSIVLCSLTSFMFGWHVHEKAIIMAILPFLLLAIRGSWEDVHIFLFLQTVGHYSLFPLIFTPFETVIKVCLILLYTFFAFNSFGCIYNEKPKTKFPFLASLESLYLCGLILVELFSTVIYPITYLSQRFAFLPLLLTSTYCAFGITWSWLKLYHHILFHVDQNFKKHK